MGKTTIKNEIKVIESGTLTYDNVNWYYKKYSDGKIEGWGSYSFTKAYSSWGNVFTVSLDGIKYPTDLFIEVLYAQGQLSPGHGVDGVGGICSVYNATAGILPKVLHLRPVAIPTAQDLTATYHIIGRWK